MDVVRRVSGEAIILAAGGCATLLQTSHPAIAQGVFERSNFLADPLQRLNGTLQWIYTTVFGEEAEIERVSAAVRVMHARVVGEGYAASDPKLQVWVNATLVASALHMYQECVGALSSHECEVFYQRSKVVAASIGCPQEVHPETYADFQTYYSHMVSTLKINPASRAIAHQVLHLRGPLALAPALPLFRLLTKGLMPEAIRQQYGWAWRKRHERTYRAIVKTLSVIYPRMPRRLRSLPAEYYMRRLRRSG